MSALIALSLLFAPSSRAGVVVPVENTVAPTGPSSPVLPVTAPGGANLGAPMSGNSIDLKGMLPLLPAPVPGLGGPALRFVGEQAAEAAAAQTHAPAATASAKPKSQTTAHAKAGRAVDQKPTLPAEPVPGSQTQAVFRDLDAASKLDGSLSATRESGSRDEANPLVESSSVESAAGAGSRFFDQSRNHGRGTLTDQTRPQPRDGDASFAGGHDVTFADGSHGTIPGYAQASAGGNAPAGALAPHAGGMIPGETEVLHDAVGAPLQGGAAPGRAAFFRSATVPNGETAAAAPGAFAAPGAPNPLALDLSGSGLIVRVRSALGGALAAPASEQLPVHQVPAASASTALLERGGMLEAFSAVDAYAGAEPGSALAKAQARGAGSRAVPGFSTERRSPSTPLWLALLFLPLLAAAFRFFR